jgi:hypothetical protein
VARVAMDSLKYQWGPPYPPVLRPAGGPFLKRPYGQFRDGLPVGRVACGRLIPFWTPRAVPNAYARECGTVAAVMPLRRVLQLRMTNM